MYDREDVGLGFELILGNVNGNNKVRFIGLDEFLKESVIFLTEKVEPCLWSSWR